MADDFLTIKVDEQQIEGIRARLADVRGGLPKVLYRAINRALTSLKGKLARAVAKESGLKLKYVRKRFWLRKATRRSFFGRVRAGRVGWPIIALGRRLVKDLQKQRSGRAAELYDRAFLATMPKTAHVGIFARLGLRRLPIEELRTDSATEILVRSRLTPTMMADAGVVLHKRLEAETERLLRGKRG